MTESANSNGTSAGVWCSNRSNALTRLEGKSKNTVVFVAMETVGVSDHIHADLRHGQLFCVKCRKRQHIVAHTSQHRLFDEFPRQRRSQSAHRIQRFVPAIVEKRGKKQAGNRGEEARRHVTKKLGQSMFHRGCMRMTQKTATHRLEKLGKRTC